MQWPKLWGGKTFAAILDANRGIGPGFDLLRLALALSIVASHCSSLTGNAGFLSHTIQDFIGAIFPTHGIPPDAGVAPAAAVAQALPAEHFVHGPARPYTLSRVPMFFALSGFLVAGSAFRTRKLIPFLGLRVLRILPALFVEVTLSAIILGAVFTSLPLKEYFTHPGFYAYFLNIVGDIHFVLPGVFENNVKPTVNGNLWTLPAEFDCYLATSVLILTTLIFRKRLYTAIFIACTIPLVVYNAMTGYGEGPLGLLGMVSVYYFFMGLLFFYWRDKIFYNWYLFAACIVVCYFLMMSTRTVFIYPALLTYITIFIGMTALPQIKFLKTGDYSYGVYLYSYPITQALVAAVPAVRGNLALLLPATIVCTGLFAFLSWHLVEKRFLFLKRYLSPKSAQITQQMHATLKIEDKPLEDGNVAPAAGSRS